MDNFLTNHLHEMYYYMIYMKVRLTYYYIFNQPMWGQPVSTMDQSSSSCAA
jgi:hypothetical protein